MADTHDEALSMKLRTELVNEIHEKIEVNGWSQKEAAEHLGITQPRVSEMLRGKLSKFSLDSLVNMLASVGGDVKLLMA
ncbi:MAG: helix-turn-helix transcriptional regulator [Sedimenticola sp.]